MASEGLDLDQMCQAVQSFGFAPALYRAADYDTTRRIIYASDFQRRPTTWRGLAVSVICSAAKAIVMHRAVPSLLLCVVLAAQEKKSVAGWVVYCDGAWEDRTDAAKPMKIPCRGPGENLWYPISPKSKLVRVSPKLGEWITARNAFSGAVHKYDCGKPGECEPPPALDKIFPEAPSSPLLTFLSDPGKAYAQVRVLLSRSPTGGNQPVIADHAVVRADAIPALADLIRADAPAGKYLIELCPFQPPASCPDKQAPEAISSKPGESAARWPRAVAPGDRKSTRLNSSHT